MKNIFTFLRHRGLSQDARGQLTASERALIFGNPVFKRPEVKPSDPQRKTAPSDESLLSTWIRAASDMLLINASAAKQAQEVLNKVQIEQRSMQSKIDEAMNRQAEMQDNIDELIELQRKRQSRGKKRHNQHFRRHRKTVSRRSKGARR